MKAIEYIKKLIRADFDNCEDSYLGDEKANQIINHVITIGWLDFAKELMDDFENSTINLQTRIELLEEIKKKNLN